MPQVNVVIAGRTYLMACDDGQQDHLQALAARLDFKIAEMRVRFGEIGDGRITVMAALTIADEAGEAEQRANKLAAEIAAMEQARPPDGDRRVNIEMVAASIEDLARRVESVARSLDLGEATATPTIATDGSDG